MKNKLLIALFASILSISCVGTDDSGSSSSDDSDNNSTDTSGRNNDNNNTDPGTGDPGTGDPGTGDPGTGDPGTGDPGTGDPGTGDPGTGDPGTVDPGDPGTGTTAGVAPGGACSCDADCETVEGFTGMCVFGVCMNQPSGECSASGSTTECPSGSRCWTMQDAGSICWPDCEGISCAGGCDDDGSCVPTDDMNCNSACGELCTGTGTTDPGTGDPGVSGTLGSACNASGECGDGGQCQAETADNGWVAGYCMAFGCGTPGAACGDNGICVGGFASDGSNICMQDCGSTCRTGYDCLSYGDQDFCYPYCSGTDDCPAGWQCDDELCVDGRPCAPDNLDGVCADGGTCMAGACQTECDATHTDGWCPDGFTCESGDCQSINGCGTWQCTGSDCYDLIQMPGPTNPSGADARARGYYIATELRYAYVRKDLTMLVQWAACEMKARYPDMAPLGLSDLSQSNGLTPGSDTGGLRHDDSTHRGTDLDTAYFQTDGTNDPTIVCGDGSDNNGNGRPGRYNDGYFCTTETNIVDWERQVAWMALMAIHPDWRVVGVDQTMVDAINTEADAQYRAGEFSQQVRENLRSLGVGAEGFWQFHHHHAHFSYYDH